MGKTRKEIREAFACAVVDDLQSPDVLVADLIFGSDVDSSNVSWLMRKLDRYKNDSDYTSETCDSTVDRDNTATSRLVEPKKGGSIHFTNPETITQGYDGDVDSYGNSDYDGDVFVEDFVPHRSIVSQKKPSPNKIASIMRRMKKPGS